MPNNNSVFATINTISLPIGHVHANSRTVPIRIVRIMFAHITITLVYGKKFTMYLSPILQY